MVWSVFSVHVYNDVTDFAVAKGHSARLSVRLSVCLSVCHTRDLRLNGSVYEPHFRPFDRAMLLIY